MYRCYYFDDKDGLEHNYLLQLECKLDIDFNDKVERAKTILQVICYLKQIHDNILGYSASYESNAIPKVIMIGSKINCFALPAKLLLPYAQGPIQGFKSASTAYTQPENQVVLQRIKDDTQIEVHSIIYDTNAKDCIDSLCRDIAKLGRDLQITDDLSEATVSKAFDFFDMYVLDSKFAKNKTSREKVAMFIGIFFSDEFSETTSGRGSTSVDRIHINGIEIKVDPDYYNKFKLLYSIRDYSRYEQKQITAITDRLLEDTDRRRKGDFYTPTIWVDEAHKLLDKNLGSNWRDEYIVWDCAWGTGNLTRDYQFKELYCSTINQEELNIGARYNKNATKFQYDFLNDDVEEFEQARATLRSPFRFKSGIDIKAMEQYINFKDILELYSVAVDKGIITLEEGQSAYNRAVGILKSTKLYSVAPGLVESLIDGGEQKKKLLFFINPPYGAAPNLKSTTSTGKAKSSISSTKIGDMMRDDSIGAASQNLYTQFIYRVNLLCEYLGINISLGIFCPVAYITGKSGEKLRSRLGIWCIDGFMIQASQFADVGENWGISFELLNVNIIQRDTVNIEIKDCSNGEAISLGNKVVYNLDNKESLTKWVRRNLPKNIKTIDAPQMSSALNYIDQHKLGNYFENSARPIGYLVDSGNNIDESTSRVFWLSCCRGSGHGTVCTPENLFECCATFAARKLSSGLYATWINCKDEFMAPDINNIHYEQFVMDSIIISLFHQGAQQSSLRGVQYGGRYWDIFNEFFWIQKSTMQRHIEAEIVDEELIDDLLYSPKDAYCGFTLDINGNINDDRWMYKQLMSIKLDHANNRCCELSKDAQEVLDRATELVFKSIKYRKQFNMQHPEYNINTWDAGWYQIKGLLKEHMPKELKKFNELFKALEDRMRPLVYELGFLYK